MSLEGLLAAIDRIQARRYSRLSGTSLTIATTGILRHLSACRNVGTEPDISAIREIIDDARGGRAVYAEKTDIKPSQRLQDSYRASLLPNRPWVKSLLGRQSFTAAEAARLSNLPANDAICRLRQSKLLRLEVVGYVDGKQNGVRLYRLERVEGENT